MALFKRRRDAAHVVLGKQSDTFIELVEIALDARSADFEYEDGRIRIHRPSAQTLDLSALAEQCKEQPQSKWGTLIGNHVGALLESPSTSALDAELRGQQPNVKLRLYAVEDLGRLPRLAFRPLLPGIAAALTLDLADDIESIAPETIERFGATEDELFALAEKHVREHDKPEIVETIQVAGVDVTILEGDSRYTATNALWAEEHLQVDSALGLFVSAPTCHHVLAHAIGVGDPLEVANGMLTLTHGFFREGPGSLSPKLWWRRQGVTIEIPVKIGEETAEIIPPALLVEAIAHLRRAA